MSLTLVAPLGDHPAVVTATFDMLREQGQPPDKVRLLCPQDRTIQQSATEVENLLGVDFSCDVQTELLPFDDANSLACAKQYLRALARVLRECEQRRETVFLLLCRKP